MELLLENFLESAKQQQQKEKKTLHITQQKGKEYLLQINTSFCSKSV